MPTTNKKTENIKIIKWLITLPPAKQVVAMLLISVVTLFTPLASIFYSNGKAIKKCEVEKMQLVEKYTVQIQDIKDKQIQDLQAEKLRSEKIDSVLRITNSIIKNNSEK